ncbi:MAG: hypothetical protein ACFFCQ_15300 [Promethearchaeota archaeon]
MESTSNGLQIVFPNGGETLNGTVTVNWTLASQYLDDDPWYEVKYSPNGGSNWLPLEPFTLNTSFIWDTSLHPDGGNYLIQVIAGSKSWTDKVDVSDAFFTIKNQVEELPISTNTTEPTGEESSTSISTTQPTSEESTSNTSPIGNTDRIFDDPIFLLSTLFGSLLLISGFGFGYFRLNPRFRGQETFVALMQSSKTEFLKNIRHKVIIGLDNIKTDFIADSKDIPQLEAVTQASMVEYFPSSIRNDLRSEMKGRTVLTLIEIAYQDPKETNPTKLAQSLKIPTSTLSKEIKKLVDLQYVEAFVSTQILQDARYRNFAITSKGFMFLSTLNEALQITIDRLKEKEIGEDTYLGN